MAPTLSVVLPALNAAHHIRGSVEMLLVFTERRGIECDVIVIDEGSTDATLHNVPADSRVTRFGWLGTMGMVRRSVQKYREPGDVRIFTDADLQDGGKPTAMMYGCGRTFHAIDGDGPLPASSYHHERPRRLAVSEGASFAFRAPVTGGIYATQCGSKAVGGDVAHNRLDASRVRCRAHATELGVRRISKRAPPGDLGCKAGRVRALP